MKKTKQNRTKNNNNNNNNKKKTNTPTNSDFKSFKHHKVINPTEL